MEEVKIHLQHYRHAAGMTLRELAIPAACPRSTLHRLEHELGYLADAFATVARISKAINVSPWIWVEYTDWDVPTKDCACAKEKGHKVSRPSRRGRNRPQAQE